MLRVAIGTTILGNKSNFTRIKYADKECFETRSKQEFSRQFRIQLHYLLVVVVSDVKVMSSTVAVIFAIT